MQLIHCIWIVSLLIAKQISESETLAVMAPDTANRGVICTFGLVMGLGLLSKLAAALAALKPNSLEGRRIFNTYRNWLEWIWVGPLFWFSINSGWAAFANAILPFDSSAIHVLLLAAPSLFLFCLFELSAYQLVAFQNDRELSEKSYFSESDVSRTAKHEGFFARLGEAARHGCLLILLPTTCVLALADIISLLPLGDSERVSSLLLIVGSMTLISFGFPKFICNLWNTQQMTDDNRAVKTAVAMGLSPTMMLHWNTANKVCNAAVVGWLPGFRKMLISDGIQRVLTPDELSMIVLHEIGHIRRFHFVLRMLPILACLVVMWFAFFGIGEAGSAANLNPQLLEFANQIGILSSAFLYAIASLALASSVAISCWIAQQTEFDADRFAVLQAGRLGLFEGNCTRAQEHLTNALLCLVPTSQIRKSSWLHPSVARRVDRLQMLFSNTTEIADAQQSIDEASLLHTTT